MPEFEAYQRVEYAEVSAVKTLADGTTVDLGVIASSASDGPGNVAWIEPLPALPKLSFWDALRRYL